MREEKSPATNLATILFADIVGCSEVSSEKTIVEYGEFIRQFHSAAAAALKIAVEGMEEGSYEFSARGDEACLILHSGTEFAEDVPVTVARVKCQEDVRRAMVFVLCLRLYWLRTEYNKKRMTNGLLPRELAVGIHHGPVALLPRNGRTAAEGYAINLAKRIEGISRYGKHTGVICAGPVKELLPGWVRLVELNHNDLKGFTGQRWRLYEVTRVFDFYDLLTEAEQRIVAIFDDVDRKVMFGVRSLAVGYREQQWLSFFYAACVYEVSSSRRRGYALRDLEMPRSVVQRAIEIEPDWWRLHNELGILWMLTFITDPPRQLNFDSRVGGVGAFEQSLRTARGDMKYEPWRNLVFCHATMHQEELEQDSSRESVALRRLMTVAERLRPWRMDESRPPWDVDGSVMDLIKKHAEKAWIEVSADLVFPKRATEEENVRSVEELFREPA